jgi:hypothetical protein
MSLLFSHAPIRAEECLALPEGSTPDPLLKGAQYKTLSTASGVACLETRHLSRASIDSKSDRNAYVSELG